MSRPSGAALAALHEKQEEHLILRRLLEAAASLTRRAETLADSGEVMADGGAAIASVLANWSSIFRIINDVAPPLPATSSSDPALASPHKERDADDMAERGEDQDARGGVHDDDHDPSLTAGGQASLEPLPRLVRLDVDPSRDRD